MVFLGQVILVWEPRKKSLPFILFLLCLRLELRAKKRITMCFVLCSFIALDISGSWDFSSNRYTVCFISKNPSVGRDLEIIYSNHLFCRLRNTDGEKLKSEGSGVTLLPEFKSKLYCLQVRWTCTLSFSFCKMGIIVLKLLWRFKCKIQNYSAIHSQ